MSETALKLPTNQFEVLHLMAQGYQNAQMAMEMKYARTSIKYMVQGALKSLGAANRPDAIRRGHLYGMLSEVPIAFANQFAWIDEQLTPQEEQLLPLVSIGMSDVEIGETLVIQPNTVRLEAENLIHKLGVVNRAHAVHASIRLGILDARSDPAVASTRPQLGMCATMAASAN
jgi:DNA-binding NarL/FixJ family response regulator